MDFYYNLLFKYKGNLNRHFIIANGNKVKGAIIMVTDTMYHLLFYRIRDNYSLLHIVPYMAHSLNVAAKNRISINYD